MRKAVGLLVVIAGIGAATPGTSAELHNVLVDYTLTSWGVKDGLVSPTIRAIAQDAEGYLWLGTEAGPVRFDGSRFVSWHPPGDLRIPDAPVRALCVSQDGTLWLGYGDRGGVSRYRAGALRTYGVTDGLPDGAVTVVVEGRDHAMWVGTTGGLFRLRNDRWERMLQAGATAGGVTFATVDRDGRLLVATATTVYRQTADPHRFDQVGPAVDGLRAVAVDRSGTIWVTDPMFGLRRLDDPRRLTTERGRGSRLLSDSRGNLWIGTTTKGLWRAVVGRNPGSGSLEKANALTGLSDDGVSALFEDADGNIWAGTIDGLNRLTPHKITPLTDLGLVSAVERGRDGDMWVGSADQITRFSGPRGRTRTTVVLPSQLTAMCVTDDGTVFAAMGARLVRIAAGARSTVRLNGAAPRRITAMIPDGEGGLWIADDGLRLAHWSGARLTPVDLPERFAGKITAVHLDRANRLWVASSHGQVAVLGPDGAARAFTAADGLTGGVYRAIVEDAEGAVWLAGVAGLTRFAGGRFATLAARDGFPAAPLTAIVDDGLGSVWLGVEASHVIRVERVELEQAFRDPAHPLHYRSFDKFDGVAGTPRWFGAQAGVRAGDGRLWFVAGRGTTIIDPEDLPVGRAKPASVRIERVMADERDAAMPAAFEPQTRRVQVDYTLIDLTSPHRTHFRYRLNGFDSDWIDAGAQRSALYTNLPPGQYEFSVMATNADGTWTAPASVAFSVQPMFYQRPWFAAACVLFVAIGVATAWRLHVRRVRHEFALLVAERARVGREIHDSLLQGLFGLALRCDGLAASFGRVDDALRLQFLQMRKELQEYIADARGSIRDLRSPRLDAADLPTALRHAADRATTGTHVQCDLRIGGTPRRCSKEVDQQVLRIAQEAIANAIRHSDATRVTLELAYGASSLTLRVTDDGRGFEPAAAEGASGHYGLALMRERVQSVGGTLTITAAIAEGATVEAVVPA